MYMRLWWKEARQFWTIWIFLVLAAAAAEWAALKYYSPDARQGALGLMALIWTGVYAVAVGAAAFAAERETGTLRLLDILPVGRPVVWAGKCSFALVTTLAMGAVLVAMAALGTDRWGWGIGRNEFGPAGVLTPYLMVFFGLIVLITLAWGLFWSSILSNALAAALSALGSLLISPMIIMLTLAANVIVVRHLIHHPTIILVHEALLFLVILVASNVLFTRTMRVRRLRFQFQSPIVITPTDPDRRREARVQLQSPVAAVRATVPAPRAVVRLAEAATVDQSPRRSRRAEALALAWETVREGATTWCLLAVIALALPVPFYLSAGYLDQIFIVMLDMAVALGAGINVFGMENRRRTQQFLTHHGARPGLVWLVKLSVWCLGLAAIWGPQAIGVQIVQPFPGNPSGVHWFPIVLMFPLCFAVALLCGMAIPRGITAAVIALVITLALAAPQQALIVANLLPIPGLLVISTALLLVSWAWSGDWLLDRPAPGRWLRLGLILTGTFAVVLCIYTGFRAWSVPDIGPIAPPRAWIAAESAPLPADRNAADLYLEASRSLKAPHSDLKLNPEALDLVRRAAARPDCRFPRSKQLTLASPDPFGEGVMHNLGRLVIQSARDRLAHGDLDGAWNDLITLFRMVRHESDGAAIAPAVDALMTEREALDLAMEWAVASRQTPEQLRSALAAIRDLPKTTPADEVLRADANLTEKTFDLPAEKLKEQLQSLNRPGGLERTDEFWTAAWLDWLTTPWERTRARRVNRLLATKAIERATLELWQRADIPSKSPTEPNEDLPYELASTPLAKLLFANANPYLDTNDLNEIGRRALVQVLAIRDWQLRHNGQFPDTLEKLVPEELPSLPIDPYPGRNFGYVRSEGQPLVPLGKILSSVGTGNTVKTTGYWLLYSVGRDDKGTVLGPYGGRLIPVFPIPPVQSGGGRG